MCLANSIIRNRSFEPKDTTTKNSYMQKIKEQAFKSLVSYKVLEKLKEGKSIEEIFSLIAETALNGLQPFRRQIDVPVVVSQKVNLDRIASQNTSKECVVAALEELNDVISEDISSLIQKMKDYEINS